MPGRTFMTGRRAIFLAVLAVLLGVAVFAVVRFGRVAPVEAVVSVAETPPLKPKSGPASVSVVRVPMGDHPEEDAEPADETPTGRLVAAAQAGDAAAVAALLAEGAPADARSGGFPALHRAAQSDSVAALEALVAAGADLEAVDRSGHTALARAAMFGRAGAVSLLLEAGADPNAHAEPNDQPPLLALLFGWRFGQSPNPLGIEANAEERLAAARALLAAGADPHLAPRHVTAAMMAGAIGGEIVTLLSSRP